MPVPSCEAIAGWIHPQTLEAEPIGSRRFQVAMRAPNPSTSHDSKPLPFSPRGAGRPRSPSPPPPTLAGSSCAPLAPSTPPGSAAHLSPNPQPPPKGLASPAPPTITTQGAPEVSAPAPILQGLRLRLPASQRHLRRTLQRGTLRRRRLRRRQRHRGGAATRGGTQRRRRHRALGAWVDDRAGPGPC